MTENMDRDPVAEALKAGREEDVIQLRQRGWPVRAEHFTMLKGIERISDALSSPLCLSTILSDFFRNVLLVFRNYGHLLLRVQPISKYSALIELSAKKEWTLINGLFEYFDPLMDIDELDSLGISLAQLTTDAPRELKVRLQRCREMQERKQRMIRYSMTSVILEDLSNGCERFPIRVVNDCDKAELELFKYATRIEDPNGILKMPEDEDAKCNCSSASVSCVNDPACSCTGQGHYYNSKGLLLTEDSQADWTIFECTKFCTCSMVCPKRVAQKGATYPVEIFRTTRKGWGVRSLVNIPQGAFIGEYTGRILREDIACEATRDDTYVFETRMTEDQVVCIDAKWTGNFTRFINHSCNPNAKVVNVNWDSTRAQLYHVCIYADRPIGQGEEITISYGSLWWKSKYLVICECGYEQCLYREAREDPNVHLSNLDDQTVHSATDVVLDRNDDAIAQTL